MTSCWYGWLLVACLVGMARGQEGPAQGADGHITEMDWPYVNADGEGLNGYLVYEPVTDSGSMKPGLLLFDGPWGDGGGASAREYAREYARKGFVVFLPDYFPTMNNEYDMNQTAEAVGAYGPFLQTPLVAQDVANRAYQELANLEFVDSDSIAAIGFCFGGAMVLNLARSGAKLVLGVSLHGEYPMRGETDMGAWNTQYFVEMVGADDPLIPGDARDSWVAELTEHTAGNDMSYDMVIYGSTSHGFTIKYSQAFMSVLAGVTQSQVTEEDGVFGVAGVVAYSDLRQKESFNRIDDLLEEYDLLGMPMTTCAALKDRYQQHNCCGMPDQRIPMD